MKIFFIIFVLCFCLTGCSNNNENNYSASRTSQEFAKNNIEEKNAEKNKEQNVEVDLSSFSTKIYTPNDEARQKNITITCSTLNGTIIKPGETFSFCNTVRKSHSREGLSKSGYL